MPDLLPTITRALRAQADPTKRAQAQRFFKTGPGQYAEGDQFLGVTVPRTRQVARQYATADWKTVQALLKSPIHEERLLALLIMVDQYSRGDAAVRTRIVGRYRKHFKYINNWDLVDTSADKILGAWLLETKQPITVLRTLSHSRDLWTRRIAMIATFAFIKAGQYAPTTVIAKELLHDDHDLIHKAVGWMLREAGKRDELPLKVFLQKHYTVMPRTMLRYAIEKFPKSLQKKYLQGTI